MLTMRCIARGGVGDGDGLGEGGVLNVVVVLAVDRQALGDGVLIEGDGKRGDVALGGGTVGDIVGRT